MRLAQQGAFQTSSSTKNIPWGASYMATLVGYAPMLRLFGSSEYIKHEYKRQPWLCHTIFAMILVDNRPSQAEQAPMRILQIGINILEAERKWWVGFERQAKERRSSS